MKPAFFASALLLAATLSFAQQNRITFGVEGGITVANLSSDNINYEDVYKSRTGYAAGIAFQYNFPKVLSLRTGVMYELTGASSDIYFTDNNGNITDKVKQLDNIDYLVVPLLLRATFGDKLNFFVNAGPYWAALLKRKWVFDHAVRFNGIPTDEFDETDHTEKTDFGIAAGIGASAVFNERIVISLEVRDNLGMTTINIAPPTFEHLQTRTILVLAGVAFKFGSRENDTKK
jgi:opacity protein-like surface antigen